MFAITKKYFTILFAQSVQLLLVLFFKTLEYHTNLGTLQNSRHRLISFSPVKRILKTLSNLDLGGIILVDRNISGFREKYFRKVLLCLADEYGIKLTNWVYTGCIQFRGSIL